MSNASDSQQTSSNSPVLPPSAPAIPTAPFDEKTFEDRLLAKVAALLANNSSPSAPAQPAASPVTVPAEPAQAVAALSTDVHRSPNSLHYSLPAPSAAAVSDVLAIKAAYAETGQLNRYLKPAVLAPFPSTRFVPTDDGQYHRIKAADTRDGHEAEVLWNQGYNAEHSLACMHKISEALADGDLAQVTHYLSVLNHYLVSNQQRVHERIDFFTYALESGKSEAILLQKYLKDSTSPFASDEFNTVNKKFAELRATAYAKELNKQHAARGSKSDKTKGSQPSSSATK